MPNLNWRFNPPGQIDQVDDPGTHTTGWKHPTGVPEVGPNASSSPYVIDSWNQNTFKDNDLFSDGNSIRADGIEANVSGNMQTLYVKAFNNEKISSISGTTVDSIGITMRPILWVEPDTWNGTGARWNNTAIGKIGEFGGYPNPVVGLPGSKMYSSTNPSFQNAGDLILLDIPISSFNINTITPEEINSPDFAIAIQYTFDGGGNGARRCWIKLFSFAFRITYTVPNPIPPGGGSDAANLIKMGSF
jgi:hypothetical protein